MNYLGGYVWLKAPRCWNTKPRKRRVCYACWVKVCSYVEQCEIEGANHNLPPEEFLHDK
jgi:hypothetical protein